MDTKLFTHVILPTWLIIALQVITIVLLWQCRKYVLIWMKQGEEQDAEYDRYSREYEKEHQEYLGTFAKWERKEKQWDERLERLTKLLDKWEANTGGK